MRNHPESYLAVLKEHFATVPLGFGLEKPVEHTVTNLFTTNQQGKITAFQRWFSFKEAFSPSFVIAAIERLGYQPQHIIDPFGGSGTTALTAQLLGIRSTTIEINPFLSDLIKSKTQIYNSDSIRNAYLEFSINLLEADVDLALLSHLPQTFIETDDKSRWIYPKAVAARISQYLSAINKISNNDFKRLFKVILGSVLVNVSNIYINGKGRRYKTSWELSQSNAVDLDRHFNSQFNIVFNDSLLFSMRPESQVDVRNGDSRKVLESISDKADLIVFSPPYPNSFDYTDIYNIELWILGYLTSSEENVNLRKSTLRSHVQSKRPFEWPDIECKSLIKIYNSLSEKRDQLWNKNIPEMITAYFKDLESILVESKRLLQPTGKVIMVVGDSKYTNVLISVADVLSELAEGVGFTHIEKIEVRKMRASSQQGGEQQLGEWIIELSI